MTIAQMEEQIELCLIQLLFEDDTKRRHELQYAISQLREEKYRETQKLFDDFKAFMEAS